MTKISETLAAARAKIVDPNQWTQGAHARDLSGSPVQITDKRAVCFCADGALALAAGVSVDDDGGWIRDDHYWGASKLLREAAEKLTGTNSYVEINDGDGVFVKDMPSHDGVLAVFDLGIDLAKSREELGFTKVAT
jgi:hypothetical protein